MRISANNAWSLNVDPRIMLYFSFRDVSSSTSPDISLLLSEKNKFYVDLITNILLMGEQ